MQKIDYSDDNYIDESVLTLLAKRQKNVISSVYTKSISKQLELDINKHNQQYPAIEVKVFTKSHDRFLIIDNEIVYHIGASLKDLGKNWVAFSKMKLDSFEMINNTDCKLVIVQSRYARFDYTILSSALYQCWVINFIIHENIGLIINYIWYKLGGKISK